MFDVALAEAGAKVVLATSSDEKHPPEHMIDGNSESFWSTTGLFPQEFIISFSGLMDINAIKLETFQIHKMSVERSVHAEPIDFEILNEKEFTPTDAALQMEEFTFDAATSATHLRFIIKSGYDHFVSVHRVNVDGTAVR
ncbi:intraflagellar transport protein 25 homolog [Glandiceps talaboti]